MTEDYDLLPHQEIVRLKDEVKTLKEQLAGRGSTPVKEIEEKEITIDESDELMASIDKLTDAINALMLLFKRASKDINSEHHAQTRDHLGNMNSHLGNLNGKMEALLQQNKQIAKGILELGKWIQDHEEYENHSRQRDSYEPSPQPRMPPKPDFSPEIPNVPEPDDLKSKFDQFNP